MLWVESDVGLGAASSTGEREGTELDMVEVLVEGGVQCWRGEDGDASSVVYKECG